MWSDGGMDKRSQQSVVGVAKSLSSIWLAGKSGHPTKFNKYSMVKVLLVPFWHYV